MPYRTLRYGLLALHVVLAVFLSATLNAWTDEYYTLRTTGSGPGHAFQQALAFELQPPFYFTTLSIWRLLIPGLLGARLFSTLMTTLGILVASRASAALLGRRGGTVGGRRARRPPLRLVPRK